MASDTVKCPRQAVTLVTWISAPEWLTIEEASELSGYDVEIIRRLIEDGAVESRREGGTWLVEKASLREFQESLLLVAQEARARGHGG